MDRYFKIWFIVYKLILEKIAPGKGAIFIGLMYTIVNERSDWMHTKELLNTKITLNPVIQKVSIGDAGNNPFVITILKTIQNKDNPFEWNILMDIVLPDGTDITSLL